MAKDVALEVKNVSKSFKLPLEKSGGIKQSFINFVHGRRGYKMQHVLHDVSFTINKGDFFGIVGRNGSGKSTLLKLISSIYLPDHGEISVNGSLVPFIELGVGFNPELTGRENVYLNGAMLGFSNDEIDGMYDDIVDFAELHEFMDQKLKNYSSGMQVRLAFSVAIKAQGDILVLDEVLAVGDEAFQRKCNEYFDKIKKDNTKTVILVTHSMDSVRKYCDKAMLIFNGEIIVSGSPEDVANEYSLDNLDTAEEAPDEKEVDSDSIIRNYKVELVSSKLINQNEEVKVRISYKTTKDIETHAVINLHDLDRNISIVAGNSKTSLVKRGRTVTHIAKFKLSEINDSNLRVISSIRDKDGEMLAFYPEVKSPSFVFRRNDYRNPKKRAVFALLFDRGNWGEE